MKQNLKKLTLAFILTSMFSLWLYYVVNLYDKSWTTMLWVETNIQYLVFLYLSIITSLTIYSNQDKKSKLILAIIILINFLYIIFSFWISNIWLDNTQWLFLIWFLVLALISNYINNILGHIITTLSIFWIITTVWFAIIPMYETWPDTTWFESQFSTQLIVYSKANINKSKAIIKLDNKEFNLSNWISSHELKIAKSWSQLLFIADKKYLNTFWYLLFPNKDIIQIYPQSAININKINNTYQIEIITWAIKHNINTGITTQYNFTGKNISFGIINQENTQEIIEFYENQLKEYIVNQIWWTISKNKIITNISKVLLEALSKILPWQYSDNLENFNNFQNYIDPNWTTQKIIKFNTDNINKWILKEISESLENTQIIK